MDKTQLITIALSALASAITKPLVEWLISVIKTTKTVKTIAAILKIAFSKTNRAVIFDTIILLFYVAVLVSFALEKAAPTKLEILIAIGAAFACLVMGVSLLIKVVKAVNTNKKTWPVHQVGSIYNPLF